MTSNIIQWQTDDGQLRSNIAATSKTWHGMATMVEPTDDLRKIARLIEMDQLTYAVGESANKVTLNGVTYEIPSNTAPVYAYHPRIEGGPIQVLGGMTRPDLVYPLDVVESLATVQAPFASMFWDGVQADAFSVQLEVPEYQIASDPSPYKPYIGAMVHYGNNRITVKWLHGVVRVVCKNTFIAAAAKGLEFRGKNKGLQLRGVGQVYSDLINETQAYERFLTEVFKWSGAFDPNRFFEQVFAGKAGNISKLTQMLNERKLKTSQEVQAFITDRTTSHNKQKARDLIRSARLVSAAMAKYDEYRDSLTNASDLYCAMQAVTDVVCNGYDDEIEGMRALFQARVVGDNGRMNRVMNGDKVLDMMNMVASELI